MRILGIDPGLKSTGYGVIDWVDGKVKFVEAGSVDPRPRDTLEKKLDVLYRNLSDLLDQHRPQVLVLEKLYAHYKHPLTACIMGHARGVICLLCAHKKIALKEFSVKKIRQVVVGNGNATKQQTQRVVAYALKIDGTQLTLDASDALALALGYVHFGRQPL